MGLFDHFPYTNFHELNLTWILEHFCEFIKALDELQDWKTEHEKEYEELKQLYDDILAGNFPESIQNAFNEWMEKNALDIVGSLVKMVYFGINDDGYFVAYIPESWNDIIFGTTGLDDFPTGVDYGHLTLSFEIGG